MSTVTIVLFVFICIFNLGYVFNTWTFERTLNFCLTYKRPFFWNLVPGIHNSNLFWQFERFLIIANN